MLWNSKSHCGSSYLLEPGCERCPQLSPIPSCAIPVMLSQRFDTTMRFARGSSWPPFQAFSFPFVNRFLAKSYRSLSSIGISSSRTLAAPSNTAPKPTADSDVPFAAFLALHNGGFYTNSLDDSQSLYRGTLTSSLSLKFVKYAFDLESGDVMWLALLKEMMGRSALETFISTCSSETETSRTALGVPAFTGSLKGIATEMGQSSAAGFELITTSLQMRANDLQRSVAAIVSLYSLVIPILCIPTKHPDLPFAFAIFNSRAPTQHLGAPAFLFFSTGHAAAAYMDDFFNTAPSPSTEKGKGPSQPLPDYTAHIFTSMRSASTSASVVVSGHNGASSGEDVRDRPLSMPKSRFLDMVRIVRAREPFPSTSQALSEGHSEEATSSTPLELIGSQLRPDASGPHSEASFSASCSTSTASLPSQNRLRARLRNISNLHTAACEGRCRCSREARAARACSLPRDSPSLTSLFTIYRAQETASFSNEDTPTRRQDAKTQADPASNPAHVPPTETLEEAYELALKFAQQYDEEAAQQKKCQTTAVPVQKQLECTICLDAHPEDFAIALPMCDHAFGRDCLQHYIVSQLTAGHYPIICPACMAERAQSPSRITEEVLDQVTLSEAEHLLWKELKLDVVSVKLSCPQCNHCVRIDRGAFAGAPTVVCPRTQCSARWCKSCSQLTAPQVVHTCDGSAEFDRLMLAQGWKRCPGCTIPVEKTRGCNHMTCGARGCNTRFCWQCGKLVVRSLDTQEIARAVHAHFGTPCRG
ncbi:hypothetical protein BOTBODRAFT_55452 [Botryobasidium botryosum FD-172 SS1]|uniref:RING-type domain-containing protein n=1 Tax=Botryobasidium botryosum (strain FD-172 SS1) TaxID=930990 RepID=A0A067MER6_BOTB1|nr:hypothetical protein BOTBODRAFT_55452 [Botryobasidium botryosum FD-172 SS1]